MRIRWGRVFAAVAGVMGAPVVLGVGGLWLTRPSPAPVGRSHAGPDACVSGEVLEAGLGLHVSHAEGEGSEVSERAAAAALVAATRCATVVSVRDSRLFDAMTLARHGLRWTVEHQPPDRALDELVSIWELAADQQQAGSWLDLAVWTTVADLAAEGVERVAPGASDVARDRARQRLVALTLDPFDWAPVHARQERETWGSYAGAVGLPRAWPELLLAPWEIWQARQGSHPIVAELEQSRQASRVRAAVLAAGLGAGWDELSDGLAPRGG